MAELEDARQHYVSAMEELAAASKSSAAGGPIIRQTADSRRQLAGEAYRRALKRFHEFVMDELIPEDLRDV